jgi:hypothetical protein
MPDATNDITTKRSPAMPLIRHDDAGERILLLHERLF